MGATESKNKSRSQLHLAAKEGDYEGMKILISRLPLQDLNRGIEPINMTPLMEAAKGGHSRVIEVLLEAGISCNITDQATYTALHYAAISGDVKSVELLLNHTDVNTTGNSTPLYVALGSDVYNPKDGTSTHLEVVKLLLDRGADVKLDLREGRTRNPDHSSVECIHTTIARNSVSILQTLCEQSTDLIELRTSWGITPLMQACETLSIDTAKYLLSVGGDVYARDMTGQTVLHIAAGSSTTARERDKDKVKKNQEKHKILLDMLIDEYKVDINSVDDYQCTPLMRACEKRQRIAIKKLLQHPDLNCYAQDIRGWTIIHFAASVGLKDVLRDVLALHEDLVALKSKKNQTALMIACKMKQKTCVEFLLQYKNYLNEKDKKGKTAFMYACKYGTAEIMELVYKETCNIDIDCTTNNGSTSLMLACKNGLSDNVEWLLKKNVNINITNEFGFNALHMAFLFTSKISHKSFRIRDAVIKQNIVTLLWKTNQVNIDEATHLGTTPLMIACFNGEIDLMDVFLDKNADFSRQDKDGRTALHRAADAGAYDIICILLTSENVDVNASCNSAITPLMIALSNGFAKCSTILIEKGASLCSVDANGYNVLHYAVAGCNRKCVDLVLGKILDTVVDTKLTYLILASYFGSNYILESFMDEKTDFCATDVEGWNVAHWAACNLYNSKVVDKLLQIVQEKGLLENTISAVTKGGFTPVMLARQFGNSRAVNILLKYGASDDKELSEDLENYTRNHVFNTIKLRKNDGYIPLEAITNGWTSVHEAAKRNDTEFLKTIASSFNEENCITDDGWTPLMVACCYSQVEALQSLLEMNSRICTKRLSPLHVAASKGDIYILKILLKTNRFDVNSAVDLGTTFSVTPLYCACHKGHYDVAKLLIANGAKSHLGRCEYLHDVLNVAAVNGFADIVELILQKFSSSYKTIDKAEIVYNAVKNNVSHEVIKVLKKYGATCSAPIDLGWQAIHYAAKFGNVEMLRELLECKDVNIDACTMDKQLTPLLIAFENRKMDAVNYLLHQHADINAKDLNGWTALHYASIQREKNIDSDCACLKFIINKITDKNIKNNAGETALMLATEYTSIDSMKILISADASVNEVDNEGRTALHKAAHFHERNVGFEERDITRIKILLAENPKLLNQKSKNGSTAFYLKCCYRRQLAETESLNTFMYMLEMGANFNEPNKFGYTPLFICVRNSDIELLNILLNQEGIEVNVPGPFGVTPLMLAVNDVEIRDLLSKKMSECPGKDYISEWSEKLHNCQVLENINDWTSLHCAAYKGDVPFAVYLCCRTNVGNETQRVPLSEQWLHTVWAFSSVEESPPLSAHLNQELSIVLGDFSPDINAQGRNGETPLHIASENDDSDMIHLLLLAGASPLIKDNNERLPADCAANENVKYFLKEYEIHFNKLDNGMTLPIERAFVIEVAQFCNYLRYMFQTNVIFTELIESIEGLNKKTQEHKDKKKNIAERTLQLRYPGNIQVSTDGSRKLLKGEVKEQEGSGAGYVIKQFNVHQSIPLPHDVGINTAELVAIQKALQYVINNFQLHKEALDQAQGGVILSDCQSALKRLMNLGTDRNLPLVMAAVLQYLPFLRYELQTPFSIQWVPAHCGLQVNEDADEAAKKGRQGKGKERKKKNKE